MGDETPPSTRKCSKINVLTHAFPRLGKLRAADVTTADVLAVLSPIWTGKTETATRVHQRIRMVMGWAVAQGWRQDNPADSITQALPKRDRSRIAHRKALPYAQVADCLAGRCRPRRQGWPPSWR
jgi:hypothetical protein